ncbi:aromatic ring-hydroxylating dioxygenase subunit alpha [Phenylobacterium sp.]|uniref:aromatic ring-hydroxylating oxygenase subunit alpha n=1 Tax=Phenylobacterium sp. TaxID=1871053 RepID=UPI0035AFD542
MADGTQVKPVLDAATIRALFDPETGDLDRRIYADEELYQLELERIYARGWNFMAHESQIPNPGDYFINYIGEDQVIVVRDDEGKVNVLLNTCRHRGNALCRAEQGNARSFVCSYHGWNYALDGRLIGVPGQKTYFHDKLDRSQWGLAHAAQVDSCHGFIFATLDAEAPPLEEFLGDVGRTGLAMVVANGEVEVLDGIQKNVISCNWKIAVDNLFDWYHVMYSHASANSSGFVNLGAIKFSEQFVMLGEYGHAISGPGVSAENQARLDQLDDEQRRALQATMPAGPRIRPKAANDIMGPVGVRSQGHPNIFPNLWITLGGMQLCLRLPRGPEATELWWFTVVPKNAPPEVRHMAVRQAVHLFGPAGLLEQDDGENWSQSTRASHGIASRKLGHTLQMGLGQDEANIGAGGQQYIETQVNEHGQRWLYRSWVEWLTARNWAELKANHSAAPEGTI